MKVLVLDVWQDLIFKIFKVFRILAFLCLCSNNLLCFQFVSISLMTYVEHLFMFLLAFHVSFLKCVQLCHLSLIRLCLLLFSNWSWLYTLDTNLSSEYIISYIFPLCSSHYGSLCSFLNESVLSLLTLSVPWNCCSSDTHRSCFQTSSSHKWPFWWDLS